MDAAQQHAQTARATGTAGSAHSVGTAGIARAPSSWCWCNGQLIVRGTKVLSRGQVLRQKTGCLACGARAVRWLPRRETREASNGRV